MRLDNVTRNIRVLWRADAIIAQAQMQQILARLGLQAFAALVFLFGLFCFELAAYFWCSVGTQSPLPRYWAQSTSY